MLTVKRRENPTPIETVTVEGVGYCPERGLTAKRWSPMSAGIRTADLLVVGKLNGSYQHDWSGTVSDWREFAAAVEVMCQEIEARR